MTEFEKTISKLNVLDLATYPAKEIAALMPQFTQIGVIEYNLHRGKTIIRARPDQNDGPYLNRASLSYKPQQFNKNYQRASTPNETMFYGSIIPEEIDNGDLDNERYIVSVEALKWLRDLDTCGYKKITYSKWQVTDDIKLFAVLHKKEFYPANSHTRKLIDEYDAFIAAYPDKVIASKIGTQFLANEFGKEACDPDFHYLISAHFTEFITSKGYDGVLYPSVRVGGAGYNIAINTNAADKKIKLIVAGECSIYKRFKNSIIDNDTVVEITDDSIPFNFGPVNLKYHTGEKECLRKLGVTSIADLCNPI